MKVYKNNEEVEKDIVNGVLNICDNVTFDFCYCVVNAHINAYNINAYDINAYDINANDINANDINAYDIKAININAYNISYYAFCISYNNINCKSINGRRNNSFHKCLDGELTIKPQHTITIDGKDIELSEESYQQFNKQFK